MIKSIVRNGNVELALVIFKRNVNKAGIVRFMRQNRYNKVGAELNRERKKERMKKVLQANRNRNR